MSDNFKVVIPVRYDSVRLPGKALADIHGQPMIQHVHNVAIDSGAGEVIIATDSTKIGMIAEDFGATVCMTLEEHRSGTDRISEVVNKLGWEDDTIVVNLQGDEPLMPPAIISQVAAVLHEDPDASCATLCTPLSAEEDPDDPNIVKVISANDRSAIYFSRAALPFERDAEAQTAVPYYRHIGLYAYRASLLRKYPRLQPSYLEDHEKLEQLRLLANGFRIHVAEAVELPGAGVDTPADLDRVRQQISPTLGNAINS